MSDTVLSGRWVVYYTVENRQKRLYRNTSVSPATTDTVRQLYSALQDLFDELNQMDDGIPIKYATPTEYSIGIIDAGDKDPWFMDRQSAEYLTNGALSTLKWARVEGSNTGILRVPRTGTNIVEADIGYDIVGQSDDDHGTLLDVQGTTLWIRPDSYAAANSFDNTSQNLTCNGHTDPQNGAPATGESLWANIYSLGTIEANTHLFVYQGGVNLTAYKASTDWWLDGHVDILVNVKEVGSNTDDGFVTVLARQFSKAYSYYLVDLSAGGRNPIPLQTGDDLDNETGYRQTILTDADGDFTVGEVIEEDADPTKQGVVTSNEGTAPNITLQYYLIGDPLNDFVNGDDITGQTSGKTATIVTPTNVGPAAIAGLSIVHAATTRDINEDGSPENYSIVIDCSDEELADVYEWCKYITRRGDINPGNTDGIEGEQYLGSDYRIIYTTLTLTVSEGAVVTQWNGGYEVNYVATGTVVAHNTTAKILILRNSRDTFNNTDPIYVDGSNYVSNPTSTPITPIAAAPFGTFAGGKFFCAPGVVLDNVLDTELNNFQLTDDNGTVRVAPSKVTILVGNSRLGDRIAVFRLAASGGEIKKDSYTIDAAQGGVQAVTIKVDPAIDTDEPGKTAGGVVRVVDVDNQREDRYRYISWDTDIFTLFTYSGIADAGGDINTLIDAGIDFTPSGVNVLVGDIIYDVNEDAYAYVTVVTSGQLITTNVGSARPITSWENDEYQIGVTISGYTTSGTAYVPLIDIHEVEGTDGLPGQESSSVTFVSTIPVRIRARQAGDIIPYEADSAVTTAGMSNNIIRTPDTVYA